MSSDDHLGLMSLFSLHAPVRDGPQDVFFGGLGGSVAESGESAVLRLRTTASVAAQERRDEALEQRPTTRISALNFEP